jgi:hypothetical protein
MAKPVPVWRDIFYEKDTIRYLSFKAAGAHGSRPVIRLKKNRMQPFRNIGHSLTADLVIQFGIITVTL